MSGTPHDPELTALEAALAGLAPRAERMSRDRLLFRAGQVSARGGRLWPCATGVLALVSAALTTALLVRPAPAERIVYVPVPEAPIPAAPPAETPPGPLAQNDDTFRALADSLRLRDRVVRFGVDAIPQSPPPTGPGPRLSIEGLLNPPTELPRKPAPAPPANPGEPL